MPRLNPSSFKGNKTLVVGHKEADALLPMEACIGAMEAALKALAGGKGINPLRQAMGLPGGGLLGMMPSSMGGSTGVFGIKACSVFPKNHGTRYDAHQGVVLLFESRHGRMLAVVDASAVTAIRTAAVSAIATKVLARKNAVALSILGSGIQARTHLEAMLLVRDIAWVRVWSRTSAHAERFAASAAHKYHVKAESFPSVKEVVDGADVVCTTTAAREPILKGKWLSPGAHINAVGACVPSLCELDAEAVEKSLLFVDNRESCLREAGDFIRAKARGVVGDRHVRGELGEILLGKVRGRTSENQITLFESQGLGIEDVAAAFAIYHEARKKGRGAWIELNRLRSEAMKAVDG